MTRRPGGAQLIPRPDTWQPGAPAPWQGRETERSVAEVLARVPAGERPPLLPPERRNRPAAVLVALVDGPRGAEVLLTKRSASMRRHRGEISFPGGRVEPGETAWHAAVREAYEEVLLDPLAARPHGELGHVQTVAGDSYMVPIVGTLAERPEAVRPSSTGEVDRVLWVPLVELAAPDTFRAERWDVGRGYGSFDVYFYDLDDETVWGATGRVLYELLTLAYGPA